MNPRGNAVSESAPALTTATYVLVTTAQNGSESNRALPTYQNIGGTVHGETSAVYRSGPVAISSARLFDLVLPHHLQSSSTSRRFSSDTAADRSVISVVAARLILTPCTHHPFYPLHPTFSLDDFRGTGGVITNVDSWRRA